jgi:hypothetical protein
MIEENKAAVVLENIPFDLNEEKIIKQMHPHGDIQRYEKNVRELIAMVVPVAKPKAVYKVGCISNKTGDSVDIDGVIFTGRLIKDNLDKVSVVFPFVASCGREVDGIVIPAGEVLKRYCLDIIKMNLAISAVSYLRNHLTKSYSIEKLTTMNPGEVGAWPITQLKELFTALGNVESLIGVTLSESYTMMPLKSRAGIFFTTETNFESCQLCLQKRCETRKAPFSPELARKYPKDEVLISKP